MDKKSIIKRVLAKLDQNEKMSKDEALEIIFKEFVKNYQGIEVYNK